MQMLDDRQFYCEYDLRDARKNAQKGAFREPATHQTKAIEDMGSWYKRHPKPYAGGILVLPTGGGKTFTALRFLCQTALSDGFKVLWLAHTHHLLEQAYASFPEHAGIISETRDTLRVRVVSGTIGHFHPAHIAAQDDVIIATLQTITRAYKENHPSLNSFLDSAGSKLFVVFDEAHHAPAPSYRSLILSLRDRFQDMYLLGLTATPVYTDEDLGGWLRKLFPQGILHQISTRVLMAQNILAKPIIEPQETNFNPNFELREYEKWVGTFKDVPEDIIDQLAKNKNRNMFIAEHYSKNRDRYGKTLIFADRWYQCEAIAEYLSKRGISNGTIYYHADANPGSAEARNLRRSDENAQVLDAFRKNRLDVVINVRMLTEGTDIPDVKTCFITRQTTSQILLTQMVGRALRGPEFGGTSEAYLVFFTDNWEQLINWAEYDPLTEGGIDDGTPEYGKRPPLQYISIELVRKLAGQMDNGLNISDRPFRALLPTGWYRVEYAAKQADSEEIEYVRRLVMVFEHERTSYQRLIEELITNPDNRLSDEGIRLTDVSDKISELSQTYFSEVDQHFGSDISHDIFSLSRHVAQSGTEPKFFPFEEREFHDLDLIAQDLMAKRLDPYQEDEAVELEFNRQDRYWQVLYITYERFKSQYNACKERILYIIRHGDNPGDQVIKVITTYPPPQEPSDELKQQVKERDGCCLCCGNTNSRLLEVDHILPSYFGGTNISDNLQTLCVQCNRSKLTQKINFRDPQTDLSHPPQELPRFEPPRNRDTGDSDIWEWFIRKTLNFFYRCGAVHRVVIGKRGEHFYNWQIELKAGNNPQWLGSYLEELLGGIRAAKEAAGYSSPTSITVWAPDAERVEFKKAPEK
ncbi:UvrABC system protein B [uncultured archaeon]|nr:UvrABC system protein B [uncultured archaeon]